MRGGIGGVGGDAGTVMLTPENIVVLSMKHLLRKYEAATSLPRCTRIRSYEAKRTIPFPCGEATLHRAKPCFIFHAP